MKSVDIIIPVYNPKENWVATFAEKALSVQRDLNPIQVNFVIVDDGSVSNFNHEAESALLSLIPNTIVVRQEKNKGKGAAVREGAKYVRSSYTLFTDLDFPFTNQSIQKIVAELEFGHDVVCGQRDLNYYKEIPPQRTLISLLFRWLIKFFFGLKVPDIQCGLKGFNRRGLRALSATQVNRFLFDLEMLIQARSRRLSIGLAPVNITDGTVLYPLSPKVIIQELLNFLRIILVKHGWALRLMAFTIFAFWLIWSSFDYDTKTKTMYIGAKVSSDFAAHIPLIRSFSMGDNWPPQYPLYSGPPIRYHFLYYWFVGKAEKLGLPLDWALNLPSVLGYAFILFGIYGLAKYFTNRKSVAWLSVLFFVLDGTFGWVQYFTKKGWTLDTLKHIPYETALVAMGPWDGGKVLAFWHLNTWTNQRHFTFALGVSLMALLFFYRVSEVRRPARTIIAISIGLFMALLAHMHKPMFVCLSLLLAFNFLINRRARTALLYSAAAAIIAQIGIIFYLAPELMAAKQFPIRWDVGFAVERPVTIKRFIEFWGWNFGLHFLLAAVSIWFAPRRLKMILIPCIGIFATGYFFNFADDVMINHKFFNVIYVFLAMCTAYLLVKIFDVLTQYKVPNIPRNVVLGLLLIPLTFSGVINLFSQINEYRYPRSDIGNDPVTTWIYENTPKKAVFFNTQYIYDPASVAGRTIYLGWAYFVGGEGHNWDQRRLDMQDVLNSKDAQELCQKLRDRNIDFIEYNTDQAQNLMIERVNATLFEKVLVPTYEPPAKFPRVFKTSQICEAL